MTKAADLVICVRCSRGIEVCDVCERVECGVRVCHRCVRIALGVSLEQPHVHGG